jgi:GTPase SAR1 family protein
LKFAPQKNRKIKIKKLAMAAAAEKGISVDEWRVSNSKMQKFKRIFQKKRTVQACFLGIGSPGKSAFVGRVESGNKSMPETTPTETFEETTTTHKKHLIVMREISSKATLRNLWKHEVEVTNVFVWFVDSTQKDLVEESSKALQDFVKHNSLEDMPWLILVTKVDKDNAMNVKEIVSMLDLDGRIKVGCALSCSAANGTGIEEAVDYMVKSAEAHSYKKGESVSAI